MTSSRPRAFGADLLSELWTNALEPGYAAAAQRRAEVGPEPPGRRRMARAGSAVALFISGLLLAVAYLHAVAEEPQAARARERLAEDVRARRAEADSLQRGADRLRDEVARERDRALAGSGDREAADRLRGLEGATGLAKVSGPGVIVSVADGPPPVDPVTGKATGENLARIFDRDLQEIVNALWAAGAEAIAIDEQRLATTSTIRAAGEAILVDFRPVASPYEIKAIGPGDLLQRFNRSATADRFRRYMQDYRMGFSVRRANDLTLPAAPEPRLRYARPQPSPSTSPVPSPSGGGR